MTGLAAADTENLVLTGTPEPLGVGDDVTFHISGGTEGDFPILVGSPNPGPTIFPIVGEMGVGPDDIFYFFFPAFGPDGKLDIVCPLNCAFVEIDPFYIQVAAIRFTDNGITCGGKSNVYTLEVDDDLIEDCNQNGTDDDCDIDDGTSEDCNDNGIPDECEPDCDEDGIPDDCDPEIDSYCVDNLNDDDCDDRDHPSRIMWLRIDGQRYFKLVEGGQFIEHDDGTATYSGVVENIDDSSKLFAFDVTFTGRVNPGDGNYPPEGSPKTRDKFNCPVDTDSWYYYTSYSGTLHGMGCYDGAIYSLSIRGPAFQIGVGANLMTLQFGAAGWFDLVKLQDPSGDCDLPDTIDGDFNQEMANGCDCE